jgi:hypothetical protein
MLEFVALSRRGKPIREEFGKRCGTIVCMRISLKILRTGGFAAAFGLCLAVCVHVRAQAAPRKVTREEAIELAFDAIDPESRKLPGLTLEKYKEEHFPDFYAFEAIWDNPDPDGSTVVDDFAVDPQTGDVWRRGVCRLQSTALAKSQAAIRKRIGLSDAEYQKLRRSGPTC